jgi:hypothetical protein
VDAYRSELAAAAQRIADLEEELARHRRDQAPRIGSKRASGRAFAIVAAASFVLVTGLAAWGFATDTPVAIDAHEPVPTAASEPPEAWSPLIRRLADKVKAGTATEDERDALHELETLVRRNQHFRRRGDILLRFALGTERGEDFNWLWQSCYISGNRSCTHLLSERQARMAVNPRAGSSARHFRRASRAP